MCVSVRYLDARVHCLSNGAVFSKIWRLFGCFDLLQVIHLDYEIFDRLSDRTILAYFEVGLKFPGKIHRFDYCLVSVAYQWTHDLSTVTKRQKKKLLRIAFKLSHSNINWSHGCAF